MFRKAFDNFPFNSKVMNFCAMISVQYKIHLNHIKFKFEVFKSFHGFEAYNDLYIIM